MTLLFKHTHRERGSWRGWLKNGQSVEISLAKHGWDFGAGVHIHSNDDDMGDRTLFLKFWRLTIVLPLGVIPHPWPTFDGPQWSAYASSEYGLTFHWGLRRKSFDWPGTLVTVEYEQQLPDESWRSVFDHSVKPYAEDHPYTYILRNGEVQARTATVTKRRHVLNRRWLRRIGWPNHIRESIDVTFSGEVGERSGSWKGGTIGCGYDLKPGETMKQSLRRMESERKFS